MTPVDPLLAGLPPHLAGRAVRHGAAAPAAGGGFVLCWLRQALRATDNPAIEVALHVADALGLPVFVYHGLNWRRPWATVRNHGFLLEAHRDLQRDLSLRGLGSAFFAEEAGPPRPVLRGLAAQAAVVVGDAVPVPPLRGWLEALAVGPAPVLAVDATNVLPMPASGPAPTRAYAFRDRHAAERARRRALPRGDAPVLRPGFCPANLGFSPLELGGDDLWARAAALPVDPTFGRVVDTPGGRTAALARWRAFRDGGGVARYARLRNDAAAPGVSRMSAHLHVGAVSVFELLDDLDTLGGEGAEKLADELLVWRELAWHWCARQADLHDPSVLPAWAHAGFAAHAADPRPRPSPEALLRGQTGDALWDLAQQSLLRHGELHNNLRMTWGKAIVGWSPDLGTALRTLVDLNHRAALDGRDPASYGGLYWCMGLFDRPFSPEVPVLGPLRPRPTAGHAARLRGDAYAAWVRRPPREPAPRVAVIGAGPAGLACARSLHDAGLPVVVFDKGRGPGGRLSTRRDGPHRFDHGAQYVTTRDPQVSRWFAAWEAAGLLVPWAPRVAGPGEPAAPPRGRWLVAQPGMNALVQHLAAGLDVRFGLRVDAVAAPAGGFSLRGEDGADLGSFDRVIVAVPAPQAVPLLAVAPALAAAAAARPMVPNHTVMLRLPPGFDPGFDVWRAPDGPLAWACRGGSRPGRPEDGVWVLQSHAAWAADHLEDDAAEVIAALWGAFAAAVGPGAPAPLSTAAHRWRFARPAADLPVVGPLWDGRVGACGDWLAGPRVEDALSTGFSLAARVLGGL